MEVLEYCGVWGRPKLRGAFRIDGLLRCSSMSFLRRRKGSFLWRVSERGVEGCDPNGGGGIGPKRGSRVCCWDCGREKGWFGGRGSISSTKLPAVSRPVGSLGKSRYRSDFDYDSIPLLRERDIQPRDKADRGLNRVKSKNTGGIDMREKDGKGKAGKLISGAPIICAGGSRGARYRSLQSICNARSLQALSGARICVIICPCFHGRPGARCMTQHPFVIRSRDC